MLTSSFFSYFGPGRIAISRSVPKRLIAGYRYYMPLAPGDFFGTTTDYETFRSLYHQQLDKLDPTRIIADLYRLVVLAEPVLLCWCNLQAGSWCHRRMFAEWIGEQTGVEMKELTSRGIPVLGQSLQLRLL